MTNVGEGGKIMITKFLSQKLSLKIRGLKNEIMKFPKSG